MKKVLLLILFTTVLLSGRLHYEKVYQEHWCNVNNGEAEVTLEDRTRVDCITDEYAVEVDFANKYSQCVGQSMYYSIMTGKKPACLLILEENDDTRYLKRLQKIADRYCITIFTIIPNDLKK